jgi:hypothetical protein
MTALQMDYASGLSVKSQNPFIRTKALDGEGVHLASTRNPGCHSLALKERHALTLMTAKGHRTSKYVATNFGGKHMR